MGSRPSPPAWAGIGDFDIVWDWQQHRCGPGRVVLVMVPVSRWFLVASKLRGAVSRDRAAAADTWYKWDGAAFSRRGLGEEGERFRDTSNRPLPSGEHPSIHWNRSPYCTLLYCAPLH